MFWPEIELFYDDLPRWEEGVQMLLARIDAEAVGDPRSSVQTSVVDPSLCLFTRRSSLNEVSLDRFCNVVGRRCCLSTCS